MSVSRRGFLVGGLAAGEGLVDGIGPVLALTQEGSRAAGKSARGYDEGVGAIDSAENGRYPIAVGAISLESPVRRADGASVPYALAEKISTFARSKGIGMHWDGARALLLSGTEGFDLRRYSALFDTVYVSLYKYLGAPFGAVLAGNKATIAKVRELRHAYGGVVYLGGDYALAAPSGPPGFFERVLAARPGAGPRVAEPLAGGGHFVLRGAGAGPVYSV